MFFSLLFAIALGGLGYFAYVGHQRRKLFAQSWDSILSRMEGVHLAGLQEIAEAYLKPTKNQLRIEPVEMWTTVGGLTGLQKMRQNSETMLQLALYAERWNAESGRVVSEMIRRDALRLKKAVIKIELAMIYPYGMVYAAFSLQEAISSYCLMRERLLGLYEVAHDGLLPRLRAAL